MKEEKNLKLPLKESSLKSRQVLEVKILSEAHKFLPVKAKSLRVERSVTKLTFQDDQDIVVLEVDNETSNLLRDISDSFTREDNETQTYDMVFRDEIKIKLLRDEKGGYKTRTTLTPDTVATLGYGSLITVTGTLGKNLERSEQIFAG